MEESPMCCIVTTVLEVTGNNLDGLKFRPTGT